MLTKSSLHKPFSRFSDIPTVLLCILAPPILCKYTFAFTSAVLLESVPRHAALMLNFCSLPARGPPTRVPSLLTSVLALPQFLVFCFSQVFGNIILDPATSYTRQNNFRNFWQALMLLFR